ncbi:MAG: hypothetical protein KUG79_09065 [Pseudomonadales bacterium]|nr:hypothetical protein [Pseudomonadales bacterium]
MDEVHLQALFYPPPEPKNHTRYEQPDCVMIRQELQLPHVTLQLLWEEYREQFTQRAYSRSQFSDIYRRWLKSKKRSMRQSHKAGEKCFVDYCGPTMPIVNSHTGEVKETQVFVAVLGASNFTYGMARL